MTFINLDTVQRATSKPSRRKCRQTLRAATMHAPTHRALSLRTKEAKQMLETGAAPIDHIAAEVGSADVSAVRRIFRRTAGIAPDDDRPRFRRWAGAGIPTPPA